MTRKTASRIEGDLKAQGVYKPYVSQDEDKSLVIESYPLTARCNPGWVSYDHGPYTLVKITDYSLQREGKPSTVILLSVLLGSPLDSAVASIFRALHGAAYQRAKAQESSW